MGQAVIRWVIESISSWEEKQKKKKIAAVFQTATEGLLKKKKEGLLEETLFELNFKGRVEIRQTDKVERVSQTEISAYAKAQGHKSRLYCMK